MTEQASPRFWAGIDITKTLAGVLAAVSAAVVGSYLGVAGTLIGAAVASIVGSVGTELYDRWIDRGGKRIRATFVTAPAAIGTPEVAAAVDETPSQPEPVVPRRIRWRRVAAAATALFVVALGVLTAFELVTRQSVADVVGNKSSKSTTICSALCGGTSDQSTPAPAGSSSPASTPTPAETAVTPSSEAPQTSAPSSGPASPAPTATTTGAPAPPTTGPAAVPATVAPGAQ